MKGNGIAVRGQDVTGAEDNNQGDHRIGHDQGPDGPSWRQTRLGLLSAFGPSPFPLWRQRIRRRCHGSNSSHWRGIPGDRNGRGFENLLGSCDVWVDAHRGRVERVHGPEEMGRDCVSYVVVRQEVA